MVHRYFPHTDDDKQQMLAACHVNDIEDLFADVPSELRLKQPYALGKPMSEKEVRDFFAEIAAQCTPLACFAGMGHYDKYTPSAVASIAARSEFLTSYTPYQPEVSQGTLQYIFEYQTMIARLTGMEISNASMYDGATATAEAMLLMAGNARKRPRVAYSATLLPAVIETLQTYARYHGVELIELPDVDGITDRAALTDALATGTVGGVILPIPNRHGIIEDYTGVADEVHAAGALLTFNSIAADLATLRTPGEWGADIAVGDAQSLGIPLSFGGPYLGYMASTKALMRKLPGRIVGATTDSRGERVFVLTLQAREQHIRREKATSNICSNQGLMALWVTIYMSLMGAEGLHEANSQSVNGVHFLADALCKSGVAQLCYPTQPFFNEVELLFGAEADTVLDALAQKGILGGVKTGSHSLLIAVTEMRSRKEIELYVETVKSLKS